MYFSAFITHTFFSLLLFQLQDTTTAKYDSGLMRLRAQKRSLADSQRSEMTIFSSSDNHLTPEESSTKKEPTTSSSSSSPSSPGGIFVDDESDSGQEQMQQSWLFHQGGPVDETTLLTACTTSNTDESNQSILPPSAKFQRRQSQTTVPPNACPPEWKDQPGQQKLKLDGQGQENGNENGERIPDDETLEELKRQFHPGQQLSKWNTYPTYLELFRLFTYGRVGDPNSICDEFVGRSVPMCAPSSLSLLDSPAEVLAPSRIWNKIDLCISLIEQFWCCSTGRELDPARTVEDGQLWTSPVRFSRAPSAYQAAGWSCSRSEDPRAFRSG